MKILHFLLVPFPLTRDIIYYKGLGLWIAPSSGAKYIVEHLSENGFDTCTDFDSNANRQAKCTQVNMCATKQSQLYRRTSTVNATKQSQLYRRTSTVNATKQSQLYRRTSTVNATKTWRPLADTFESFARQER